MTDKVKNIEEIIDRGIYICKNFVKEKDRHFQAVHAQGNGGEPIIVFVPCIGGDAFPIDPEKLQAGIDSGDVELVLVETP